MKYYDLLLVVGSFRRSSIFLPVIKYLSTDFNIAVLSGFNVNPSEENKTSQTDQLFFQLCHELGAEIVDAVEAIAADIAIIPQWPYLNEQIAYLKGLNINKYYWMPGLTMGNYQFEFLGDLKPDKILVIDKDLYQFRLNIRKEERSFEKIPLLETGMPFKQYPVFTSWGIDYLLASPTPLSLPTSKDRLSFLQCVNTLLNKIPDGDVVAYKPHNADERYDYIVNHRLINFVEKFSSIKLDKLLVGIFKYIPFKNRPGFFANLYIELQIVGLYRDVMSRIVRLNSITPHYNISLETFLPNVKKGLITGRSNSIWHALLLNLPVYNCADDEKIKVPKEKMNFYSMQYFGVPYCRHELAFDTAYFQKVDDRVRNVDFVAELKADLLAGRE